MAREDLIPSYLAEAFSRAIPQPTSANAPLQKVAVPVDTVNLVETVTAAVSTPTSRWQQGYWNRMEWQP